MENLEFDSVTGIAPTKLFPKLIRALLATGFLGTVAAYGAIAVRPELVDYLSFIPGMEPVATQCSAGSCSVACEVDGGSCSTQELSPCPSMACEAEVEPNSETLVEDFGKSEL